MRSRKHWVSSATAPSARPLRRGLASILWLAIGAGFALAAPSPARAAGSALSIWHDGAWREWWRAEGATDRWPGPEAQVTRALEWQPVADGVAWATARLACFVGSCTTSSPPA